MIERLFIFCGESKCPAPVRSIAPQPPSEGQGGAGLLPSVAHPLVALLDGSPRSADLPMLDAHTGADEDASRSLPMVWVAVLFLQA